MHVPGLGDVKKDEQFGWYYKDFEDWWQEDGKPPIKTADAL